MGLLVSLYLRIRSADGGWTSTNDSASFGLGRLAVTDGYSVDQRQQGDHRRPLEERYVREIAKLRFDAPPARLMKMRAANRKTAHIR
jgi:hypothetical protein